MKKKSSTFHTDQDYSRGSPESEQMEPETIDGTIINAKLVSVRKRPSPTEEVITVLPKDDHVEILEALEGYYKVRLRTSEIGYISSNFCKLS